MTEEKGRVLGKLPVFPGVPRGRWRGLCVEGLVAVPAVLTIQDLERLPPHTLMDDFRCEEGWTVPGQRWEGVPVALVLELARVLPGARYVAFTAGDFTASLSLEEAMEPRGILALRLNGEPLPPEHGGPCRLVAAGKTCYYSVKWVERVRVAAELPADTAPDIALSRLRAYPKSAAARNAIQAHAKCNAPREFSTFFSHRMSNRRKRFIAASQYLSRWLGSTQMSYHRAALHAAIPCAS